MWWELGVEDPLKSGQIGASFGATPKNLQKCHFGWSPTCLRPAMFHPTYVQACRAGYIYRHIAVFTCRAPTSAENLRVGQGMWCW